MSRLWRDRAYLREEQYRTDKNLSARQSIYAHQRPRVDLAAMVLDLAVVNGREDVVDVGCGNGDYLARLARRGHQGLSVGVDLSEGMLVAARERVVGGRFAAGDAVALPLRDGTSELTLAMHMLYHVPEPSAALAELRRVTALGGRVVVGLNGQDHLRQLSMAYRDASAQLEVDLELFGEGLRLDDGERLLRQSFPCVVRHDFIAELVLTDRAPITAYIQSSITTRNVPENARAEFVGHVIASLFAGTNSEARITTHAGCFICS